MTDRMAALTVLVEYDTPGRVQALQVWPATAIQTRTLQVSLVVALVLVFGHHLLMVALSCPGKACYCRALGLAIPCPVQWPCSSCTGGCDKTGSCTVPLQEFYEANKEKPLTLLKWLNTQAGCSMPGNLSTVRSLMDHPAFQITNPNSCYSLFLGFARSINFHAADGSGYEFIGDAVLKVRGRKHMASCCCVYGSRLRRFLAVRMCTACLHDLCAGAVLFYRLSVTSRDLPTASLLDGRAFSGASRDIPCFALSSAQLLLVLCCSWTRSTTRWPAEWRVPSPRSSSMIRSGRQ